MEILMPTVGFGEWVWYELGADRGENILAKKRPEEGNAQDNHQGSKERALMGMEWTETMRHYYGALGNTTQSNWDLINYYQSKIKQKKQIGCWEWSRKMTKIFSSLKVQGEWSIFLWIDADLCKGGSNGKDNVNVRVRGEHQRWPSRWMWELKQWSNLKQGFLPPGPAGAPLSLTTDLNMTLSIPVNKE